jgi:hypothetical protein
LIQVGQQLLRVSRIDSGHAVEGIVRWLILMLRNGEGETRYRWRCKEVAQGELYLKEGTHAGQDSGAQ